VVQGRIGMRETATLKADRLLVTGAVSILEVGAGHALAQVVGDHDTYTVEHGHRWRCDCPAFGPCSHALAVARVVVVQAEVEQKVVTGRGMFELNRPFSPWIPAQSTRRAPRDFFD
jgi:hypothetical protein